MLRRLSSSRPLSLPLLVSLGALCVPLTAVAQIDAGAFERQNQLLEQQQRERLREDQERALRALPAPGGSDLRQVTPSIQAPALDATCRDIRELRIVGSTRALPDALREQLQADYGGQCLGVSEIEAVLASITKSYIERGYVTTRAYLAAQDLRSGVLEITVVEGTLERLELERSGSTWQKPSLGLAFPVSPGELLNLRDLEQGIDQLNRLGSNNATLDIQPGSQQGSSVVLVKNQARRPIHLFTSADNLGQPSTGRTSGSATVVFDGVLGLNELLSLTRRQSVPRHAGHHSGATAFRAVLPVGYTTLTYDVSDSTYFNTLTLPSGMPLVAEGSTLTHSLGADRVVFRDQASRISLSASLSSQRTRSWLGGEFLGVSSRTLSTLDLGAAAFTQVGGGIANGRLGYVRGLNALGALRDADALPRDLPHAQFSKFTLDLGYSRGFLLGNQALQWSSQWTGQKAKDTLYGAQQMMIGGYGSVRGALGNSLAGDSGYYWRNELSLPWRAPAQGSMWGGRVYVGYDFGRVSNRAAGVPSGSMSGVTLGTAVQWGSLNLDIFASRTLRVPAPMKPEAGRVGVRLSHSL